MDLIFVFSPEKERRNLHRLQVLSIGNENSQEVGKTRFEVGPEVPLQCVPIGISLFEVRGWAVVVSCHMWPFGEDFDGHVRAEFSSQARCANWS